MNGLLGSIDDPRTAGLLGLGLRLMSTPGKFGQALGQSGLGAMGDMRQAQQSQDHRKRAGLQEQLVMLQLQQAQQQQEQQKQAQAAAAAQEQQRRGFLGSLDSSAGPSMPMDPARALNAGLSPQEINLLTPKGQEPIDYNKMVVPGPDGKPMLNPLWVQGKKATLQPSAVVNVNTGGQKDANWGSPPKDYVWARDASGNIMTEKDPATGAFRPRATPIGGSKDAAAEAQAKTAAADKARMTISTIDQMLKHPGLNTAVGLSGQTDPRNLIWGTQAQGARALIEQAQGQAFLQAFESLKGGGQITQIEGDKATAAIARLKRAQSDKDFRAAANELKQIAETAYMRATGQSTPTAPAQQPAGASLEDLLNKYGN